MTKKIDSLNIKELNGKFEDAKAEEILKWGIDTFKPRIALTSSFGAQSAVLLHMATKIQPDIPVLFIDTTFLFKETYEFVDQMKKRFSLNLKSFRPSDATLADARERLKTDNHACCDKSKVECMTRALEGLEAWIAGLRRDQANTRKNVNFVEKYQSGMVKIHPIAKWTSKDVSAYMKANDLPYHPLWEKGYTSIGCEPCTKKPTDPGDERSGRWAGTDKTECGIHTFMDKDDK